MSQHFQGARVEGTYEPGTRVRTTAPGDGQLWGDNEVLEAVAPKRLVHTWRSLYDPEMAAEPEAA